MKKFFLIAVLLVQGSAWAQDKQPLRLKDAIADFPRSQLQLKTKGPVSIDLNQGERAAYQMLADIAGINIVFDPDFRDSSGAPTRIENTDVLQAFDLLSVRTGSFVEVLNANTVIVSPDNPTKRRDYEFFVLKTFYLPNAASPQRTTELITTLRTTLNARYLATSTTANAVIMRDTPARIAAAEKIIGLSMPLVAGPSTATKGETIGGGHILTLDAGVVRDSAPSRSTLKVNRRPVTLKVQDNTRALFERLAELAGLNVIFDPDYRSTAQSFQVDNLDILDAIDVLALQTRSFWEPVDGKTILVAPDNQTKRRDFQNVSVKMFYLPNASNVERVETITALRTLLNARYLAFVTDLNAIVMRDTADRLALAERIVTDLRKTGGVTISAGFPSGSESGFVLNRRASESAGATPLNLQSKVRGPFSFDMNDSARATYEAVAAMAGLRIVFDVRFQDSAAVPFKVQNVSLVDTLDFLSLQTRTVWQMMDRDTVLVAPDSQTVRAELLPKVTKTITSTTLTGPQRTTELVTLLRTILNIRQMSVLDNSIVMTDTAENVAFSEKIVRDLETGGR